MCYGLPKGYRFPMFWWQLDGWRVELVMRSIDELPYQSRVLSSQVLFEPPDFLSLYSRGWNRGECYTLIFLFGTDGVLPLST